MYSKEIHLETICLSSLLKFAIQNSNMILRHNHLSYEKLVEVAEIISMKNISKIDINKFVKECESKGSLNLMSLYRRKVIVSTKGPRSPNDYSKITPHPVLDKVDSITNNFKHEDIENLFNDKDENSDWDEEDKQSSASTSLLDNTSTIIIKEQMITILSEQSVYDIPEKIYKMIEYINAMSGNMISSIGYKYIVNKRDEEKKTYTGKLDIDEMFNVNKVAGLSDIIYSELTQICFMIKREKTSRYIVMLPHKVTDSSVQLMHFDTWVNFMDYYKVADKKSERTSSRSRLSNSSSKLLMMSSSRMQ